MRFACFDHGGKSFYLVQQLLAAGHTSAERLEDTDIALLDCDWPWAGNRPGLIQAATDAGAKVVLYPHGGMPTVFNYDGIAEPHPGVSMRLEHGTGSLDIAAAFGMNGELRQQATGWLYCPTEPFAPADTPRRVLFAPMHPNIEAATAATNGRDIAPALNQQVYRDLLALDLDELVVSVVGPPHMSGLWPHPRAKLVQNKAMSLVASHELLVASKCDAVVAAGTFAALAVALGKPTVMLGQGDWSDYVGGVYRRADHADAYQDLARYPLDVGDGDLGELLARACAGDAAAAEWRARFVGDDGVQQAVRLIEQLIDDQPSRNVTIQGATARGTGRGR